MIKILRLYFVSALFLANISLLNAQSLAINHYRVLDYERNHIESDSFHFTVRKNIFSEQINSSDTGFSSFKKKFFYDDLIKSENRRYKFAINPELSATAYFQTQNKEIYYNSNAGINFKSDFNEKLRLNFMFIVSQVSLPSDFSSFIDSVGIVLHYGRFFYQDKNIFRYFDFEGSLEYSPTENIRFSAGKERNFLGAGIRSLLLSDNSNSYPYFKSEIDVWKIKYIWLIADMYDKSVLGAVSPDYVTDKRVFMHYLSLNIGKYINFNFFESVLSTKYDENFNDRNYDWSYYNPVIFYRPAEFANGTSDNALMGAGLNFKYKKTILYTQFMLDDLIVSEFKNKTGWWGNKFGVQAGIKSYDLFKVPNLFFALEYNAVRPYTYSHGKVNLNYGNYYTPLAHPLGANFEELALVLNYRNSRLIFNVELSAFRKSYDTQSTVSFGGDIYKSYEYRTGQYDIRFLQGEKSDNYYLHTSISYLINPQSGLKLTAGYINKERNFIVPLYEDYLYFGISTNISRNLDFFE